MITRENRFRSTQAAKGFVRIPRSVFDHPLWQKQRKFTPTEALVDLYRLARSLPTEQLKQGEFQCTYQELADRWGWTRGRAQRFMVAREKDRTIIHLNRTGVAAHVFAVTAWVETSQIPTKPPNERASEHAPKPPKPCPVAAVTPADVQDVEHETPASEQKKERTKERKASELRFVETEESEKCSNPGQAAAEQVAAVSRPTRQYWENRCYTPPQYPEWYFTRPRAGITKAQARSILNRITLEILPRPPANSWVSSEIARWRGRL